MATHAIPYHTSTGELYPLKQADSRQDSGTGSRLFEINIWMWRYGRTFPREITVSDSVDLRKKRLVDSRKRAAATLKRRREAEIIARAGNNV
jgi:hypothetical protein